MKKQSNNRLFSALIVCVFSVPLLCGYKEIPFPTRGDYEIEITDSYSICTDKCP